MNFTHCIIFLFFCFSLTCDAQQAYWVFFNDKCSDNFDASTYFDKKAIERRVKHQLPSHDFKDLPVCDEYITQLTVLVDSIGYATRWLNALAVYVSENQLESIENLSFVRGVHRIEIDYFSLANVENEIKSSLEDELLKKQLERMGVQHFKENSLTGQGIRVAIFDAGFPSVNTSEAFEHIRKREGIIATYDFVKKRKNVYDYNQHGTNVMSCIGGMIDGKRIGMATGAEFLLARTENAHREPFSEEQNWLAAVEWADKNGADIINSSLAYTFTRYFSKEMNGKRSLVAKAANIAAAKGILVVSAAGNDGDNSWKYIGTPGDADSALTVGGIDPNTDYHIDFSSFGPTSDKRIKPNVAAFGEATVAGKSGLSIAQGTSFATPLVAGFAACVMQNNSTLTNMEVFHELEKSGHLYPYFDYAHGYGVPQARYFTDSLITPAKPTFEFDKGKIMLSIKVPQDSTNSIFEENLMYYHVVNSDNYLNRYFVVSVDEEFPLRLYIDEFKKGQRLRVHYKGYTATYNF